MLRRSRSSIARVRTSSVFRAASITESGRARIAASRKPLRSALSSASSTSSEAGGSDPSSFICVDGGQQALAQGVDLGVRAGAGLRELQRQRFAADAAGGRRRRRCRAARDAR